MGDASFLCVCGEGRGGHAGLLPSVMIKAETGTDTKKETGEVAGLESVRFERGREGAVKWREMYKGGQGCMGQPGRCSSWPAVGKWPHP